MINTNKQMFKVEGRKCYFTVLGQLLCTLLSACFGYSNTIWATFLNRTKIEIISLAISGNKIIFLSSKGLFFSHSNQLLDSVKV